MQFGKLAKALSFTAGLALAFLGVADLVMAASGAVVVGSTGAYVAGAVFLLGAAPLLVFPFSVRLAKGLGIAVLLAFAVAALWMAFGASPPPGQPWKFRVAAVAFAGLLLFRIWLARRGKVSRLGT